MKISLGTAACTVIVVVSGAREDIATVVDHASNGLAIFREFDGFVAGATQLSDDGTRIVQYLQWSSREAYDRCINDPRWQTLESSRHFRALVRDGVLDVDVGVYNVIASLN